MQFLLTSLQSSSLPHIITILDDRPLEQLKQIAEDLGVEISLSLTQPITAQTYRTVILDHLKAIKKM